MALAENRGERLAEYEPNSFNEVDPQQRDRVGAPKSNGSRHSLGAQMWRVREPGWQSQLRMLHRSQDLLARLATVAKTAEQRLSPDPSA
jgi:hypothetical protein